MKITDKNVTIAQSYDEDGGKVYRHYVTERKGVSPKKKIKENKPEVIEEIIIEEDEKIITEDIVEEE